MKIYGDVDYQGAGFSTNTLLNLAVESDFPQTPTPGRVLFANGRVMICVDIVSGVPVWVPLTQQIESYIHTQTTADSQWTVPHNLNTSAVIVQILDENNHTIIPNDINLSVVNVATITFNTSVKGRAICMIGATAGVIPYDVVFTQSFVSSSTWVVTHGVGYYPNIQCYIGGYLVQPVSIVNDSTTQATVTFSSPQSGFVNCE